VEQIAGWCVLQVWRARHSRNTPAGNLFHTANMPRHNHPQ